MICPNCGMETDGKFCPSCGTRMPAPEPAVPVEADETAKQAETVVSAAAAAIAAETLRPEPASERPAPAPAQSFVPGQPASAPGFVPNQAPPSQSYNPYPNQAPNPGYAPQNPTYAVQNPGYVNQGYAPNQAYNPYGGQAPSQGYMPAPGYNPNLRNAVPYRAPSIAEIGQSPASQLLRKLGTCGAFLTAVILSTVAFLIGLIGNGRSIATLVKILPYYQGSDYEFQFVGSLCGAVCSILFSGLGVLLLWLIFGAAANKRSPRMGTGALTTFKVFFIILLVLICILLACVVLIGVLFLVLGDNRDASAFLQGFSGILAQYGLRLDMMRLDGKVLFALVICGGIVFLIFSIFFYAKLIKTINTAKRVVRTGRPDDRVSPFAAVLIILGALFTVFGAVSMIATSPAGGLISGVASLLSAAASVCFAVVIFKFRSGMRRLGVYRGVMTQPMQ